MWRLVSVGVLMWGVVGRHALRADQAVEDGALVVIKEGGGARPAEEVASNLQHVVLGACLLSLRGMLLLQRTKAHLLSLKQ